MRPWNEVPPRFFLPSIEALCGRSTKVAITPEVFEWIRKNIPEPVIGTNTRVHSLNFALKFCFLAKIVATVMGEGLALVWNVFPLLIRPTEMCSIRDLRIPIQQKISNKIWTILPKCKRI